LKTNAASEFGRRVFREAIGAHRGAETVLTQILGTTMFSEIGPEMSSHIRKAEIIQPKRK
jgi:hypothetical protein